MNRSGNDAEAEEKQEDSSVLAWGQGERTQGEGEVGGDPKNWEEPAAGIRPRALPTLFSSLLSQGTKRASPSVPGNLRGWAPSAAHPTLACPLPQPSPPGSQGSLPGSQGVPSGSPAWGSLHRPPSPTLGRACGPWTPAP